MITNPQSESLDSDRVNSPELSVTGKVTRKAISSPEQAYSMAVKMEKNNQERNDVDAIILKKYNGAQPYEPSALRAAQEDWRSNAPTGFMSGIVDRITPAPQQAIDAARYLTSASLNTGTPEDERKSKFFQLEVTRAIRSWDAWRDFLASLSQEDVLMGRAAPLNLNPYSPWPKMFRGDEVFFDDGVGQHARVVPALTAKEDLLIHEFVDFIQDGKEIAEAAGWNFDACIEVVNNALPKVIGMNSGELPNARSWEDAIREGNYAASHSGAKVVKIYHALAVEPDTKKVTHYIVNRDGKHELLFHKESRFEKMEDVVTLFCLQPGNGKYYSSRGIGRLTINTHISIERSRNGMLDNLIIGGMKILMVPANTTPSLQSKVVSPFVIVSADGKFEEHGVTANVQDYILADDQVSKWMEQLVGSYVSGLRTDGQDPNRTATEATIDANRDAQAKTAYLARFWGQFADLISQITRRLCDPETTDEIAKDLQERLLDPKIGNLTKQEVAKLAAAPAAQVVQDLTNQQNQAVIASYQVFKGDPDFDQHKLKERVASAMVNPAFTMDVLLPEQGVNPSEIEQARQQMLETEAILAGAPGIPVSPRDNDSVHLKVIFTDLKGGLPKIAQSGDPAMLDHMNAQLVHSSAHIKSMEAKLAPPEELKPFIEAQKAFEGALKGIGEQMKQQMEQRSAQGGVSEAPQPPLTSPDDQGGTSGPPEPVNADKEAKAPSGGMSEKVLTSWIAQYSNLPAEEQRKLETISGLGAAHNGIEPIIPMARPPGFNIPPQQMQRQVAAPMQPQVPPPVVPPTAPEAPPIA